MRILQWTLLPNLLVIIFRTLLTAFGKPHAALVVMLAGLVVNALLNWMLVFGHWGAPALGMNGSAWASFITTFFMAACLGGFIMVERRVRRFHLFGRFLRVDRERLAKIFRIGTPIAITLAFEVTIFAVAVYFMGWIDLASVAAHAIAIQVASITFMVPLGLSQATVVRVGLAYGARDQHGIALAGWVSLGAAMAFMIAAAGVMWLFPREIVGLFIDPARPESAQVLELAVSFLAIAAVFQLADGAQVIGAAMLRGLQDTRIPMYFAAIGYWAVGLGSGYWLAFHAGFLGRGIWIGFALGLGAVAVLMVWRWSLRDRLGLLTAGPLDQ
jgi:MATE family multidrug resistance protein